MATMHRIFAISLSLLLVMSFCSWGTSKGIYLLNFLYWLKIMWYTFTTAYNVRPSKSQYHQQSAQSVSSTTTNNGHYRKHNPDYDDWLFYVHDLDEDGLHSRRKRGFYETISNFTRTSVYNLFNWGKSSFSSSAVPPPKINKDKGNNNIIKNVTPRVDNEVQEAPLPIPRVKIRKVVEHLPESKKHCKCTSSERYNDVRIWVCWFFWG